MAFSDLFNQENLAKLGAGLNQGIGNLTSTPLGQFGVQMLANSGYRADNAGMGERLGAALQGVTQMQQQQALQQYRRDQIATEQARQAQLQEAWKAKQDQAQRYQQAIQNPDFLAQLSPMARQFAQLGVDPGELLRAQSADNLQTHRDAQMAQQQSQFEERMAHLNQGGGGASQHDRTPTPRQFIDMPMGNNQMQRMRLNPQTGQYENFGQPFHQYAEHTKTDPLAALLTGDGADASAPPAAPAPTPPNPALPGTAPLQSYAPRPPVPLVMGGAMPQRNPNPNSVEALAQAAAPAANRSSGGPATPKTQADYDALPSGAKYIDPASGRVATKR